MLNVTFVEQGSPRHTEQLEDAKNLTYYVMAMEAKIGAAIPPANTLTYFVDDEMIEHAQCNTVVPPGTKELRIEA